MRRFAQYSAMLVLLSSAFATLFSVGVSRSDAIDYVYYNQNGSLSSSAIGGVDISVTDDRTEVAPGRPITYTVKLQLSPSYPNYGKSIDVDLFLPNQVSYVSATNGGFMTTVGNVHWSQIVVTRDQSTLKVQAEVSPLATERHILLTRAHIEDREATDTTTISRGAIEPGNAFLATLDTPSKFVAAGSDVTYTLTVRNVSSLTTATNISVMKSQQAELLSASDYPRINQETIDWGNIIFAPGESKTLTFTMHIDERLPKNLSIRTRALIGNMQVARDVIIQTGGLPPQSLSVSITDDRTTVERHEILTYVVHLANRADAAAVHANVSTSMPIYGEFLSADQGGVWDGTNVRWMDLKIGPNASRDLHFSVRVRPDAVFGSRMQTSVSVNGSIARDETEVVRLNTEGPSSRVISVQNKDPLITKFADTSEAFPGGKVRYTLQVRNRLGYTLTNATIEDHFNPAYFSLDSFDPTAVVTTNRSGDMRWTVPTLAPGETWTVTYTLAVSPSAPYGVTANTAASLVGDGMADVLGETNQELKVPYNTETYADGAVMPTTGTDLSSLSVIIVALTAIAGATIHRRKLFS